MNNTTPTESKTITLTLTKILTVLCGIGSFAIPFFLGEPQLIVGVVINAFLILAALFISDYRMLMLLIILPSLGAVSRGLIFGPFTPFLLYVLPFIWIGNAIMVYLIHTLVIQKKQNYFFSLFIASTLKTVLLFGVTFFMVRGEVLPKIFLQSMGFMQFLTAAIAGILVWVILQTKKFYKGML